MESAAFWAALAEKVLIHLAEMLCPSCLHRSLGTVVLR